MNLRQKIERYTARFGKTFSLFAVNLNDPAMAKKLESLIDEALKGDREAITDQDLGLVPPKDALI